MLTHDQTVPDQLCKAACIHIFLFTKTLQGSTEDLLTLCHCIGKVSQHFFLVNMREEMQQTFQRAWSWKCMTDVWVWSRVLPAYPIRWAHCTSWLLWKQEECEGTCVPKVERTWQSMGTHANAATHAYACTQAQKHTSVTYLCVKLTVRKVGKGANGAAAAHTHTHTADTGDSILQTGQPFKQLSVTVTHSNPKTIPLSLPPQETQIHCPVKGEPKELADRECPTVKGGCNFTHSALTKVQHYPLLKVQEVNYSTWEGICGRTESGHKPAETPHLFCLTHPLTDFKICTYSHVQGGFFLLTLGHHPHTCA